MNIRLAFILGVSSIIGQVLLLRELTAVFYGNETAYAVILASWLCWIGAGSFALSRAAVRVTAPRTLLTGLFFAVAILLPLTITATRLVSAVLHIHTGEIIGVVPMCLATFVLVGPLTLVLGAAFTAICRLPTEWKIPAAAVDVNRVYLFEALGAVTGGCIYSFVLIHFAPALHVACGVSILNCYAAVRAWGRKGAVTYIGALLSLALFAALLLGALTSVEAWTRRVQWRGMNVVASADSPYGHLTLTRLVDEYSLYENGTLSFSTRDDSGPEEVVHYALLEHPAPRNVLLIGNGLGGALTEVLKHPLVRVDYVELDPTVIRMARVWLPREVTRPLSNPRVRILHTDGRLHVKRTPERYDAIIINLGDPYNALINRYYTREFFREARHILTPRGMLTFSVSSSENYVNDETRDLLRSINTTLGAVFPAVISIPGERNIFIACPSTGVLTRNPAELSRRLRERGISTRYVSE
ncbi:MAG: fused MFS/spermidine synthase, partial [Candidatus Omnitrophica bacterium]|nr:fused MFS/spermidine synthase [Candidatus Omnitrophota bacterium]